MRSGERGGCSVVNCLRIYIDVKFFFPRFCVGELTPEIYSALYSKDPLSLPQNQSVYLYYHPPESNKHFYTRFL